MLHPPLRLHNRPGRAGYAALSDFFFPLYVLRCALRHQLICALRRFPWQEQVPETVIFINRFHNSVLHSVLMSPAGFPAIILNH